MEDRLFGLDVQLLFDAFVAFILIMIMYKIMSELFYKPVREFLEKRQAVIAADRDEAKVLQSEAVVLKAQYEEKLKVVQKEAEEILSASRKAALKQQDAIIDQAKSEASAIMKQADEETRAEKLRIREDVLEEMENITLAMATQFAGHVKADAVKPCLLEALKEIGGETWFRS